MKAVPMKLTGKKKELEVKYLREMDKNLDQKPEGWEEKNMELSRKIAKLLDAEAVE